MNFSEPFILNDFDDFLILYKPAGWFVHPPEDKRARKQFKNNILTHWFEDVKKIRALPVHRLDFATEGLLIWAKTSESAGELNLMNREGLIQKKYHAIIRGYVQDQGRIDLPLLSDSSFEQQECQTLYKTLSRLELPVQINSDFPSSRYSLLEVEIKTGRWHQIRRHFNQIHHPLVGDREHGDSHHNRFFRDHLKIPGLLLRASSLTFDGLKFEAPLTERWQKLDILFKASSSQLESQWQT